MKKIQPVIIVLIAIWAMFLLNWIIPADLRQYGIIPRKFSGLTGIILAPFLHKNILHILSNTMPFLILGSILCFFYTKRALSVILISGLLSGLMVWIFARSAIHIGLSGVIYALASFLIFAGFFQKKFLGILISIIVIISYGGMVWGLLPVNVFMSWEGHLAGAVSGYLLAHYYYRKPKIT